MKTDTIKKTDTNHEETETEAAMTDDISTMCDPDEWQEALKINQHVEDGTLHMTFTWQLKCAADLEIILTFLRGSPEVEIFSAETRDSDTSI